MLFEFDDTIDSINFESFNIDELIFIYMEEIDSENYEVKNPYVDSNYFKVTLEISTSFLKANGKSLF